MAAVIQVKRGTASSWTSANTVLAAGEIGFETDTRKTKVGDGSTAWNSLSYTVTDGDISGVTAGTGLSGGGTSGSVTLTNSMATAIDAKADLIVGTGADTFDRLAVGADNTVLTADSSVSPTGLKWAAPSSGGMTLLATGTLSGATPSITGISGAYTHLELWVTDPTGTGANIINIRFNSDTGANYGRQLVLSALTPTVQGTSGTNQIKTANGIITSSNQNGFFYLKLPFYSTTASSKHIEFFWARVGNTDAFEQLWGGYNSTSAISSIQFFLDGGSTFTGGDYSLYGIK